jgi:competence protein ComEC
VNWKRWLVVIAFLSLVCLWQEWPDERLRVVFCDVGQGDASLVVLGSFQALIDTGPSEDKLFDCLGNNMPFWDRHINLVFISHPQKDHNGALSGLVSRYRVDKVVTEKFGKDVYRYGELYFDILLGNSHESSPEKKSGSDENEDSMVVGLRYYDFSALFTADIGEKTELALISMGVLRKTTVLKVPHHGSKFSSCFPFLEKLRPAISVVSVGKGNSYGHPNSDTLIRLEQVGSKVLRTDQNGSVGVVYDGKRKLGIDVSQNSD